MADLKIRVGADVAPAIDGLRQLEGRMRTTTAAGQTFGKGLEQTTKSLQKLPQTSSAATQSLVNLSRVAQDAPFGFIGIANNINPLLESFQRLKVSTGSTGGALKALGKELTGPAGVGLAVGVVSSLLVVFGDKLFGAGKAAKSAEDSANRLKTAIDGVISSVGKEAADAAGFIAVLKSETETRERKLAAIKELQQIQPDVFRNLKLEGDAVVGLDAAYTNYLENLKQVIAVKVAQAKLEGLITKQLQQQEGQALVNAVEDARLRVARSQGQGVGENVYRDILGSRQVREKENQQLQKDIERLFLDIQKASAGIRLKFPALAKPEKSKDDEDKYWYYTIGITKDQLKAEAPRIGAEINRVLETAIRPKSFLGEEAFKVNEKALNALREKLQVLGDVALTVGSVFSSAFDGLFQALVQGGNAIQAFGQAFIQALTGVISKLIQTAILAAIVSALGGGVGIGANSNKFGDIFKLLSGFGGFRAGGGPVEAGKTYAVGERGMELFTPSVSGRIIPNNQIGSVSTGGRSSGGGSVVLRGRELRLLGVRTTNSQIRLGVRA